MDLIDLKFAVEWDFERLLNGAISWLENQNSPSASQVGILCSPEFAKLIEEGVPQDVSRNFQLMLWSISLTHCFSCTGTPKAALWSGFGRNWDYRRPQISPRAWPVLAFWIFQEGNWQSQLATCRCYQSKFSPHLGRSHRDTIHNCPKTISTISKPWFRNGISKHPMLCHERPPLSNANASPHLPWLKTWHPGATGLWTQASRQLSQTLGQEGRVCMDT